VYVRKRQPNKLRQWRKEGELQTKSQRLTDTQETSQASDVEKPAGKGAGRDQKVPKERQGWRRIVQK
jgi:hypothetical protein